MFDVNDSVLTLSHGLVRQERHRNRGIEGVGDAGHPQPGQRVTIEGTPAVDDVTTEAGSFYETTVTVEVTDGRLTMQLGPQTPGHNTCVNWIEIRPK